MRRLSIAIAAGLALITSAGAHAQAVYGYTYEQSQGTYTPLSNPTVIYDASKAGATLGRDIINVMITPSGEVTEETNTAGFNIGFDINICGFNARNFVVSGAGFVQFGNGTMTIEPDDRFLSSDINKYAVGATPAREALATYDAENNIATKISYQTIGNSLIVQYENYGVPTGFWGDEAPLLDMQIRIDKDGTVSYCFSNCSSIDDYSYQTYLFCGIRADEDFICFGGDLGDSLSPNFTNTNTLYIYPTTPDGYTLTLNKPENCVAPALQPLDVNYTGTSTSLTFTYQLPEDADNILAVCCEGKDVNWTPQNGTYYKTDETIGDVKVAYFGQESEFTNRNLKGGTEFHYKFFAVKAFGFNGPAYNTLNPVSMTVSTLPEAPTAELVASGFDFLGINATANAAGDDIIVIATPYCERDVYGDHGLFGNIPADVKTGDVLEVPADYYPIYGDIFPAPENGGKVVYMGKATNDIRLSFLNLSTGYFIAVYSRNSAGVCSSDAAMLTGATYIQAPYEGNSDNFPNYSMPQGWQTSETDDEAHTFSFRDNMYRSMGGDGPSQGTQYVQQEANLSMGNTEGMTAWMMPQPVVVNDLYTIAKFDYSITESSGRFDTHAYNDWAEGDLLEILVSADNGETWESVSKYVPGTNPEISYNAETRELSYVSIEADLTKYVDQIVLVKLQWTTHSVASWGVKMFVDRFTVNIGEMPETPIVTVNNVAHDTAVVNWRAAQTDFELAWKEADAEEETIVTVEDAQTYTLEGLNPLTEYSVRVRGLLADEGEEAYTEWSEPVVFTTLDWPEVEAPTDLVSDLDKYQTEGTVDLSWTGTEEMLSYIVAYRVSSDTEWTEVETSETAITVSDLLPTTRYIWKVKALCTHDRETSYSAQANFTTPELSGVVAIEAVNGDMDIYTVNGIKADNNNLVPGVYIIRTNAGVRKVIVK